jgi:hypothetical protein
MCALKATCQLGKENNEWFTFGGGRGYPYFANDMGGKNFGGSFNSNHFKKFYTRYAVDVTYNTSYRRSLWNFNYSYGKEFKSRYFLTTISTGPSINTGRLNNNKSFLTIGLSANLTFCVRVLPDLALGIEVFSNSNFLQSTHGVRIIIAATGKGFSDK